MTRKSLLRRGSLAALALLLSLLPLLCSCTSMAQRGAMIGAYKAYNKGDYGTALRKLSSAEGYSHEMPVSQRAEAMYLKGRCLEGLGNLHEAASLYEYLIKTYPDTEYTARAHGRLKELRKAP